MPGPAAASTPYEAFLRESCLKSGPKGYDTTLSLDILHRYHIDSVLCQHVTSRSATPVSAQVRHFCLISPVTEQLIS